MNLLLQTQANTVAAWVSGACLLSKLVNRMSVGRDSSQWNTPFGLIEMLTYRKNLPPSLQLATHPQGKKYFNLDWKQY